MNGDYSTFKSKIFEVQKVLVRQRGLSSQNVVESGVDFMRESYYSELRGFRWLLSGCGVLTNLTS